jgi:tRNA pseudouridine38-40 synthase
VRYRARVEYDGTDFAGFQFQPGSRTVQGELEKALGRVSGDRPTRIEAAGRTDAGVHSVGQLIAFDYRGKLTARELSRALDGLLPADVAVQDLRRADTTFRPRYAASEREYRYTIWNGPRSPLRERYALGVRAPLDVAAMAKTAEGLVGRRDFSAFSRKGRPPIRTLSAIRVKRTGRTITIDVIGEAFLRQMVRSIVAALLRVGRGEATSEEVWAALDRSGRAFAGEVAPARGLCLRRVGESRKSQDKTREER